VGKGGRCVRLTTLPSSCAVVMKSGNLSFVETSGPLQACNGTALPFTMHEKSQVPLKSDTNESLYMQTDICTFMAVSGLILLRL
jgi:hypothetical protein